MNPVVPNATETQADRSSNSATVELPYQLVLELVLRDPDSIQELCAYPEGLPREEYAAAALRIGLLALRQARGQLDADLIRRESERLLSSLESQLQGHSSQIFDRLTGSLKDYFYPESGRFEERLQRLIRRDGELEDVLRRQIGGDDSELCRTLVKHVGRDSELMRILSPSESQGLLARLADTLREQLTGQREQVLREFSLDNKQGALARLVQELTTSHGQLNQSLQGKIDTVVKQFSLDEENSALSRLVDNVRRAQQTITSEFSLDNDQSALSRLNRMLTQTNQAIHGQLTLDDENSALARLKRELFTILETHARASQQFQEEVKVALGQLSARKEEAGRSTRHGQQFEEAAAEYLTRQAQAQGDVLKHVGNSTGQIKNCKVGDFEFEMGPDSAAPGAKIVLETKEKADYSLASAREEIELARKNRQAQVGLFVFSRKTAPAGLDPVARYGQDVFIVWDAEDAQSDLYFRVGLMLARALTTRLTRQSAAQKADFTAIDAAVLEVEKQTRYFDDLTKWSEGIRSNADKIVQRLELVRSSLGKQVTLLQEKLHDLRQTVSSNPPSE